MSCKTHAVICTLAEPSSPVKTWSTRRIKIGSLSKLGLLIPFPCRFLTVRLTALVPGRLFLPHYGIRTDLGVDIRFKKMGIYLQPNEAETRYRWNAPGFEAFIAKYGWHEVAIYVSTLTPAGDKDHSEVV